MESIVFRPSDSTRHALATYIDSREREIMKLSDPGSENTEYWRVRARNTVLHILSQYVVEDTKLTLKEYNAIQRTALKPKMLQRGRRQVYRAGWTDTTYRLALRHHIVDKLVAHALGVPFNEPVPLLPEEPRYSLIETIDVLNNFEAVTGYHPPLRAYTIITREDRALIHPQLKDKAVIKDWCEHGQLCIKYEEYLLLRADPEVKKIIEETLIDHATKCGFAQPTLGSEIRRAIVDETLAIRGPIADAKQFAA